MEKYQTLQNLCQVGIAVGAIMAALCTYGAYYFGQKKDLHKNNISPATLPIFELDGFNERKNILNDELDFIEVNKPYSLRAKIPENSVLKVTLSLNGEAKQPKWMIAIGGTGWDYTGYDDGTQSFLLNSEKGDIQISFRDTGKAELKIYFNGQLHSEKEIDW